MVGLVDGILENVREVKDFKAQNFLRMRFIGTVFKRDFNEVGGKVFKVNIVRKRVKGQREGRLVSNNYKKVFIGLKKDLWIQNGSVTLYCKGIHIMVHCFKGSQGIKVYIERPSTEGQQILRIQGCSRIRVIREIRV